MYVESSINPALIAKITPNAEDQQLRGKNLVVVMCGIRHRDEVYRQLHRFGVHLFFLEIEVPFWAAPYGIHIPCSNPESPSVALASLLQYINDTNLRVDGVVTFDEYAVVATSYISSELNLPGIPPAVVRSVKHKYAFRRATTPTVAASPQALLLPLECLKSGKLDPILEAFPYPCVLKPVAGAGSYFVRRISSAVEAKEIAIQYYTQALVSGTGAHWMVDTVPSSSSASSCSITAATDDIDHSAWFMLEAMLVGQEVDMDIVVQRGQLRFLGIADNRPSEGPAELFMEAGGDQPSLLPASQQQQLRELAEAIIASFDDGLTGVFHLEAIVGEAGAAAVEMNLRLGGSEVLAMVLAVYGVHLGVQAAKLACGIEIPIGSLNEAPLTQCRSINVLSNQSGTVTRAGVCETAWEVEGAVGAQVRSAKGRKLLAPPHGFDYVGWAVGMGKFVGDVDGARDSVNALGAKLICDVEPLEM